MSYSQSNVQRRNEWKFSYTAASLADAAKKKTAWRRERCAWWQNEYKKVMNKVKESGISVSESLATKYSSNMGHGPQVMVDSDLQKQLTECHVKIREHNQAARDYAGWEQMLSANKTQSVELNIGDWLYFFGDDLVAGNDEVSHDDDE